MTSTVQQFHYQDSLLCMESITFYVTKPIDNPGGGLECR